MDILNLGSKITEAITKKMDQVVNSMTLNNIKSTLVQNGFRGQAGLKQGDGENRISKPDCGAFLRGGPGRSGRSVGP